MKLDNLHYSYRSIDGYHKPFNYIVSQREPGKSTGFWLKAYKAFCKNGYTTLALRRMLADISDEYIRSVEEIINKFTDDNITLTFSSATKGITTVYIGDKPFFAVVALSNPLSRIKSLVLRHIKFIVFDEFICNIRMGEKYLKNEVFRFKEIYNTFQREADEDIVCYFLGNPYSRFNPYWDDLNLDYDKLTIGSIKSGSNWVIEIYQMKPELRDLILKRNPLYQFDDSYTKYAFEGAAVNDKNIWVIKDQPKAYQLLYCFIEGDKTIGVYMNQHPSNITPLFWVGYAEPGKRKSVYCLDFADLKDGTAMITVTDRKAFGALRRAIGNHRVAFTDISVDYAIEEIFMKLGGSR